MTTESLRSQITKDLKETIYNLDKTIKVIDFQLVHEEGNYYNGTLTTKEDGETYTHDVSVIYDGANYKWEILE